MRDFYVFGFKSREDYGDKSLRSYDDEKRRLESWLGEYMEFRRTADGKYTFISIDSRHVSHNPLFKAWKTKSFTNGDITLHFILFDILTRAKGPLSLSEITDSVDTEYLCAFDPPMLLDESTVRKKLKEYSDEGLICISKDKKKSVYSLSTADISATSKELLDFYSEIAPCGVIGSFLLDKKHPRDNATDCFTFKHHYITNAIDSDILFRLFDTMTHSAYAEITTLGRQKTPKKVTVVPLKIFISVQNGRQYLMAWCQAGKELRSFRLDYILSVKELDSCDQINEYRRKLEESTDHMWGVIVKKETDDTKHIEFTVHADDDEDYIYRRLIREKRCGTVEVIDKNTYGFSADVYDINEMIPWIRTFICRITDIQMEDKTLEAKFKRDLDKMYRLYGIGGDGDAVQ